MECVGRATFVMWAVSYFLSADWLQAILQEFIIYQTGWYPLWQDGSGWSLTPLGLPGEKKANRDALAPSITMGLLPLSLNWPYSTLRFTATCTHANRQIFFFLFLSFLTHWNTGLHSHKTIVEVHRYTVVKVNVIIQIKLDVLWMFIYVKVQIRCQF